jgi:tyrosyl-tRNA synthetase
MVGAYLRYFTDLSQDEILALDHATAEHPEDRHAQRALAREVCTLVHGAGETEGAETAAGALFGEEVAGLDEATLLDVFADAPSTEVPRIRIGGVGGVGVVDLLVETGLERSKSRARTTVEQGGAYLNNLREREVDRQIVDSDLVAGRYVVLRRGKRDYHLVRFV